MNLGQPTRLLRRAGTIANTGDCILANGGERNYAQEKMWTAFITSAAALIDDLDVDGQGLISKIEVLIDGELR